MKKVAYFCEEFSSYRISIIKRLSESCDVTVVCNKFLISEMDNVNFKIKKIPILKMGPFLKYDVPDFKKLCSEFDVVIGLSNLRFYQLMFLCLVPRSFKLALWGIGVTGSYTKSFGSFSFATFIRMLITRFADGLIFYSDAPVRPYRRLGFKQSKMFIAHNTVDNLVEMNVSGNRNSFIFVGSLYKAKGLECLVWSYKEAMIKSNESFPKLYIIGGGELYNFLEKYIVELDLSQHVVLTGPIYDKSLLKPYFDNAIFCVSPMQAGLSVLTSMSYGVPFITCKNAITGGELLNIKNNYNGLVLNDISQLIDVFVQAVDVPSKFYDMGKNSFDYYRIKRHPDIMINALLNCVEEI